MLKFVLTCIQILIGFYWAGDMARQNPKIDAFVGQLEVNYGNLNERMKDVTIAAGLAALRRLYGYAALAFTTLFFILPKLFHASPALLATISTLVLVSAFGWFSIKWCLEHKKTITEMGSQISLMIFGPVILGAFDILVGSSVMQTIGDGFYQLPVVAAHDIRRLTNPMAIGAVVSLLFTAFFLFYYALTWLLTVPAALLSVGIVLLPVMLARFIHTLAPRVALVGFSFVIFVLVTLWSLWL